MVLVLALVLAFSGLTYAHSPSEITVDYNQQTKVVSVKITHPVGDVSSHYVDDVKVYLNGEQVVTQKIGEQIESSYQMVKYQMPAAKSGSNLKVEAMCNIAGMMEKEITIE